MESDEILSQTLGDHGIALDDHIVVYSDKGPDAGFILAVLDYAGAENISLLNGGIQAWRQAGLELSTKPVAPAPKAFAIKPRTELLVHNDFVKANLDNPRVVIVDVRILQQSLGALKHPLAKRPGRLPGSTLLPINGLYEDHSLPQESRRTALGALGAQHPPAQDHCPSPATPAGGERAPSLCCAIWATRMCGCTMSHGLAGWISRTCQITILKKQQGPVDSWYRPALVYFYHLFFSAWLNLDISRVETAC